MYEFLDCIYGKNDYRSVLCFCRHRTSNKCNSKTTPQNLFEILKAK